MRRQSSAKRRSLFPLLALALAALVLPTMACASDSSGEDCAAERPSDPLRRLIDDISPRGRANDAHELAAILLEVECETGIESHLLLALIERESHFDLKARGPRGSVGLMQLRPSTARSIARRHGWGEVDEKLLEDARMNVRLGTVYLAAMHRRFGTWEAALTAYNTGPSRLSKRLKSGGPSSSRYSRAILSRRDHLRTRAERLTNPALAENR